MKVALVTSGAIEDALTMIRRRKVVIS